MTSRHQPFVFHKQYVLTLSQAGATIRHVRPAENATKHKRPFVLGWANEEGKQESENEFLSKGCNEEFHEVKSAWIMGRGEGGRKPERAECEDEMKKLGEGLGKRIFRWE